MQNWNEEISFRVAVKIGLGRVLSSLSKILCLAWTLSLPPTQHLLYKDSVEHTFGL